MTYDRTPVLDRPCPVCGTTQSHQLYQVTLDEAAQHFSRAELDPQEHRAFRDEIAVIWGSDRARVLACDNCEFCFADPYVAGSPRFYAMLLKNPSFTPWRWEFARTAAVLRQLVPAASAPRLLEIGGGDGAFIRSISPAILPKDRAVCTEYSPAGVEAIRKYGVHCEMTDVRRLKDAGYGDFTFVCLFQVLEHLDDLEGLARAVNDLAHPGAHIFMSVPNDRFITICEQNGGLLDMPPNHLGRWNRKCFEAWGCRHGWKLIEHHVEPSSFRSVLISVGGSRYIRKRSQPGTVANRTSLFRNRALRRLVGAPLYAASLAGTIPVAWQHRDNDCGSAQWVHYRRGQDGS